jgi:hypothetical protein
MLTRVILQALPPMLDPFTMSVYLHTPGEQLNQKVAALEIGCCVKESKKKKKKKGTHALCVHTASRLFRRENSIMGNFNNHIHNSDEIPPSTHTLP